MARIPSKDRFEERWRRRVEAPSRLPVRGPAKAVSKRSPLEVAAGRFGLRKKGPHVLSGEQSGLEVTVRWYEGDASTWKATIRAPGLPDDLALGPETTLTVLRKSLAGEDVLTYDAAFDRLVSVAGDARTAVALLDHRARKRILALLPRRFLLRDQRIEVAWTTRERSAPSVQSALELKEAISLAGRLSRHRRRVEERLLHNARKDPNAGVRLRNLGMLIAGLGAPSVVGVAKEHVLLTVSEALDEEPAPDAVETALLVLEAKAALEDLRLLAERALIRLFARAKGEVKVALAEVLGQVGGKAATEVLLPDATGLFVRRALKQAAKRAIAEIDKRTGQGAGRLSVLPGDRGQLALSREAGTLTVVEDD